MKSVVVFESMFGNTELVARKIAEGLAGPGHQTVLADVREVGADDLAGAELLVIGAPTHAFSLSRQSTRDDAVRQGAEPSHAALGVREWLETVDVVLPASEERPRVACFDTRVEKVRRLPGSAAKRAARTMRTKGFVVIDRPRSFYVEDTKGPLTSGEMELAREWGARLLDAAVDHRNRSRSVSEGGLEPPRPNTGTSTSS